MAMYPVCFNLVQRKCVVVGGGAIAERKIETLLEFGAVVTVVSPELTPRLRKLADESSISCVQADFEPELLEGAFLVIAATNDRAVNEACSAAAQKSGIPVNVVDDPDLCTFIVPAVVRRGDLVIGVSTSGKSPALARRIREQIDEQFGTEYGDLVELMNEFRDQVRAKYSTIEERNAAYVRIMTSDAWMLLADGRHDEALETVRALI